MYRHEPHHQLSFEDFFCFLFLPFGGKSAVKIGRGQHATIDFGSWYQQMQSERQANPFHADNHLRPAREFLLPQALGYNFDAGLERIWEDLCNRLAIDPADSPLQRIRPCNGPQLPVEAVTDEQRRWIARDYDLDLALQRQLDHRLAEGTLLLWP